MSKDIQQILLSGADLTGGIIYFIGIGGMGMSAIARFFNSKGCVVYGYDRSVSPLVKQLEEEGMYIHDTADVHLLNKDADIVVYTPAIPDTMPELVYYRENGYKVVKRSEILEWITERSFNICISGTHGKSTITTLIAHILRSSGYGCNAFLGAISVNYNTNFWSSERRLSVVEADEFDHSFLRLSPDIAVITAMDADHLDIYGNLHAVEDAYIQFSQRIRKGGILVHKKGLKRETELNAGKNYTYSLGSNKADYYAENLRVENGVYIYDVVTPRNKLKDIELHLGGVHNVENSVAAIAVVSQLGIETDDIRKAIAGFRGVKRRFEYILRSPQAVLIDDYAHHPAELKALLSGVRSLYSKKITVIFQPHLYSRTRDLADDFAASLDLADEVILLPIYPAREKPIEGISSKTILDKMHIKNKMVLSKEEILEKIKTEKPSLLVMCGAGDIDALVKPVKDILEEEI